MENLFQRDKLSPWLATLADTRLRTISRAPLQERFIQSLDFEHKLSFQEDREKV